VFIFLLFFLWGVSGYSEKTDLRLVKFFCNNLGVGV